jgi:hypothetical protein
VRESGCCGTVKAYRAKLLSLKRKLRTSANTKTRVDATYELLSLCRDLLGKYQASRLLTQKFRLEVEPTLKNVYTRNQLSNYVTTVIGFASEIEGNLKNWQNRLCK